MRVTMMLLMSAALAMTPSATPAAPGSIADQTTASVYPVIQNAQPQKLIFPDESFRAHQPQAGPPRPFHMPRIKQFTLHNGVEVYLVERHTLPIVSMDLKFDGGALTDPHGKEGLSRVCMAMLTEGTENLDKIAYASTLADMASDISAYSTKDTHGLSLTSLSKYLDRTFALFVDTLRSPGLRTPDFERMIKRRVEALKQAKGNPVLVERRVSRPVLYGPEHPFGTIVTEHSLDTLTLADCKHYVATWLKPQDARLFVVGDITEAELRALFGSEALASWKGVPPKVPSLDEPKTMSGRIFFVNVPGATQSEIALLQFGPKRTAPDFFVNTIMANTFGGGFAGRINMNLREDKGYSYGASGGFRYSRDYGVFSVHASVRTDATYQSLLEIHHELLQLQSGKKPAAPQEVDREKQGTILALPERFATGKSTLRQYKELVYFGLPLDYYDSYVANLEKVTVAQVNNAAARQLKPDREVFLVVGDGEVKVKVRDSITGKDVPYTKNGKQLSLREALAGLAADGGVGDGEFVELDTDGVRNR
jgi:zinc protease